MPMQAESLEILEKASVAPAQASAIVRAIEIEIAGAADPLATKNDLVAVRHDFDALRHDFDALRHDFDALRHDFVALRHDFDVLRADVRSEIAKLGGELHAEIHRAISGSTRQMYMALLGHMAMTLGFIYFLNTQLR
jgi:hypothetical protein